jgi:hypothetical protein
MLSKWKIMNAILALVIVLSIYSQQNIQGGKYVLSFFEYQMEANNNIQYTEIIS